MKYSVLLAALLAVSMTACSKKEETTTVTPAPEAAMPAPDTVVTPAPDVNVTVPAAPAPDVNVTVPAPEPAPAEPAPAAPAP